MESAESSRLHPVRTLLGFFLGSAVTLLVVLVVDGLDLGSPGFPYGWSALWLITTIGSVPLGIVMLVGPSWRSVDFAQRRGVAFGYLGVGFINTLGLAVWSSLDSSGPALWYLVTAYALVLLVVYAATQPRRRAADEELFP